MASFYRLPIVYSKTSASEGDIYFLATQKSGAFQSPRIYEDFLIKAAQKQQEKKHENLINNQYWLPSYSIFSNPTLAPRRREVFKGIVSQDEFFFSKIENQIHKSAASFERFLAYFLYRNSKFSAWLLWNRIQFLKKLSETLLTELDAAFFLLQGSQFTDLNPFVHEQKVLC